MAIPEWDNVINSVWVQIQTFFELNDDQTMAPKHSINFDCFIDRIVNNFKTHYEPQQNLSVDESMVGFKGRLSWIQYMPKKPRKWGIKIWTQADSTNGYVSSLKVYTGKIILHHLPILL